MKETTTLSTYKRNEQAAKEQFQVEMNKYGLKIDRTSSGGMYRDNCMEFFNLHMGCDEIVVNTGAQIMVHDPWTYVQGNARTLREVADQLDQAKESILDVYMTKTREGVSRDQVAGLMEAETWMRGEKAAEYFDLGVKDAPAAAAAVSVLFGSYKNLPDDLKQAETEKENRKKRAKALLDDLYQYGT